MRFAMVGVGAMAFKTFVGKNGANVKIKADVPGGVVVLSLTIAVKASRAAENGTGKKQQYDHETAHESNHLQYRSFWPDFAK
jgi:hypothetical protein